MIRFRKFVFFAMIPVAAVCILAGKIYYQGQGLTTMEVVLCTLENAVLSFIARPSVGTYFAFRAISEAYSPFEVAITHIYGGMLILAPILTTSVVLSGFETYLRDLWQTLRISTKEKLFVVGDSAMARRVAEVNAESYFVHFLMPEDTKGSVRLPLLKKKVRVYPADYGNMQRELKMEKAEKSSGAVLCFDGWFDHYKTITDTVEYLVQNCKRDAFPLYLIDAPALYQDTFEGIYRGFCKKYGRDESLLSVRFYSVFETNAKEFFRNPDMTVQPGNRHHILFFGLGAYGRAILTELIRYMAKAGMTGTIEVVDRDMEKNLTSITFAAETMKSRDLFSVEDTPENACYSGRVNTSAGSIQLNYYRASIEEMSCAQIISSLFDQDHLTEAFFCIEDIAVNFVSLRLISVLLGGKEDVRLYFRTGSGFGSSFEALRLRSDKFRSMPAGLPELRLKKKEG